jgi:hypothetical protein
MKVYLGKRPAMRKTVGAVYPLAGQHAWWENIRILRYADVVLMYAEAANELGNSTEALQKLEWGQSSRHAQEIVLSYHRLRQQIKLK